MSRAAKTRIGGSSGGMLLTPEEFDAIPDYDDRYHYQLINGVLVVNPLPAPTESGPNGELAYLFHLYQHQHPQGSALDAALYSWYVRTMNRRLVNRVVWAGLGRMPDPEEDVPTIAIEFVSRAKRYQQRDFEEKRYDFLTAGVKEYWIIDRFRRVMTVYCKDADEEGQRIVREGEVYRTELLPGFELELARILAEADEWAQVGKRRRKR